jgi:hypothetical protein
MRIIDNISYFLLLFAFVIYVAADFVEDFAVKRECKPTLIEIPQ